MTTYPWKCAKSALNMLNQHFKESICHVIILYCIAPTYPQRRSRICLWRASPWQREAIMLQVERLADWLDGLNSMERSQEA